MLTFGRNRRARLADVCAAIEDQADAIDALTGQLQEMEMGLLRDAVADAELLGATRAHLARAEQEIRRINAERDRAAVMIVRLRADLAAVALEAATLRDCYIACGQLLRQASEERDTERARADREVVEALDLHDQLETERRRCADLEDLLRKAHHDLHAATHPADPATSPDVQG